MTAPDLVEHFFRHEYGRLVAVLSRRVGVQHIEVVEDAVQSALLTALESWTHGRLPGNPSAWVFRVASNELMGHFRQRANRQRIVEQHVAEDPRPPGDAPEVCFTEEMRDDLLRMLFVCCDENIPIESQLVLALKTLCGFSVGEIAVRLFTSDANVYKRLSRARARLKTASPDSWDLSPAQYGARLPAVHRTLYLLFTEGYLSSNTSFSIRRELCREAIRLATILAEHPRGKTPDTLALLALMHLHAARMTGRQDASGGLLLLEEQDRDRWDRDEIARGLEWLAQSAQGDRSLSVSRRGRCRG